MLKSTRIMIAAVYIPIALVVLFLATYEAEEGGEIDPARQEVLEAYAKIRDLIVERYVEEVDSRELLYQSVQGMIKELEHSKFYCPENVPAFNEEISGKYVGLGLTLSIRETGIFVASLFFGSPAARKLSVGDEILALEGTPVGELTETELVEMMRGTGEVGSVCVMTVRSTATSEAVEVTIPRERIQKPSVTAGMILEDEIGYLWISCFHEHTFEEFKSHVEAMRAKGLKSLIMDLRFNAGGLLDSAVMIANLFIARGVLVQTRGRFPGADQDYTAKRKHFAYPDIDVAVLVNRESASAAEVLAGSLKDHDRAVLVGTRTFGKGVVQSAMKVELFGEPVYLKIPVALYLLPSGRSIDSRIGAEETGKGGLEPDLKVPLPRDVRDKVRDRLEDLLAGRESAAAADEQLEAALRIFTSEDE